MKPYTPQSDPDFADLGLMPKSPWDQPKRWEYGDGYLYDRIGHREVEDPTKRPRGAYDPREFFQKKTQEDDAKRTPDGGLWHPAHGPAGGAALLRPVKHERSETQDVPGGYRQVYGRGTPQAGQPLPKRYAFEQDVYPNLQEALGSAIVRSELEGQRLRRTPLTYGDTGRYLPASEQDQGPGVQSLRKLPYDDTMDPYREKYRRR